MNKQKGFTLIELIVVIAIIAILAAIVLVNVTSYINKSKDAAIRSDLSNIALGMAVCFAETNTYVGCSALPAYVPTTLATDISTQNGGTAPAFGTPTLNAFCVSAKLATSASSTCVDSTGVTKDNSVCSAAVCP